MHLMGEIGFDIIYKINIDNIAIERYSINILIRYKIFIPMDCVHTWENGG